MINPTELRALMNRHGNAGVVAVGFYLGAHYLWSRHRVATIVTSLGLLSAGAFLLPARKSATVPQHKPATPAVAHQSKPLFARARKLFRAEHSWSWGGWDHEEYRWISDTELFYAEYDHLLPDSGRIMEARLYRRNIETGEKVRLKGLEQRVNCFYHSQIELSPDGKWLLWNDGIATLDGKLYKKYTRNHWTTTLGWTPDSRYWLSSERTDTGSKIILHDLKGQGKSKFVPVEEVSFPPRPNVVTLGDHITYVEQPDPTVPATTLSLTSFSLLPHPRQEYTKKITIPAYLPNPNITYAVLSPNTKQIALVVGYGATPVTTVADHLMRDYSLFVCRIDGSEMQEIGTWQEETNPNMLLDLQNLRWLPSGKGLSFFYKDTLYTVPINDYI